MSSSWRIWSGGSRRPESWWVNKALAAPERARVVQARPDGPPVVTNGPFPEGREFLVGYWIVDCDSEDRATEIAALVSAAPGPGGVPLNLPVEVRQVMRARGGDVASVCLFSATAHRM